MNRQRDNEACWIRRPGAILAVLVVVAFLLRLAAAWALGDLARGPEGDEGSYVPLARALAEGRGFVDPDGSPHLSRTPAVPFLASLVLRVAPGNLVAVRVVMCAIGALLVPVCFFIARAMADVRAATLAGVAAAVFPHWLYFSGWILTDVPCALTVAATAWLLVKGCRQNALAWLAAAGLVCGLSILIRPTGLVYLPGVLLWLFLVMPDWPRRLAAGGVTLAAVACVIGPWSVRNSLVLGRPAGASAVGGLTLWVGNNPNATGILGADFQYYLETGIHLFPRQNYEDAGAVDEAYKAEAVRFIKEHPGRFLELCAIRFYEFWKIYSPRVSLLPNLVMIGSFGVALPFFLLQLARRGWRRGPEMLCVLLIASQTAVHTVFTSIVRYRMPIEPLIIAMAAAGAVWIADRIRRRPAAARSDTVCADDVWQKHDSA